MPPASRQRRCANSILKYVLHIETRLDFNWSIRLYRRPLAILTGGDTGPEELYYRLADCFYCLSVCKPVGGDPHWYKGFEGSAALTIDKIDSFENERHGAIALKDEARDLCDEAYECKIPISSAFEGLTEKNGWGAAARVRDFTEKMMVAKSNATARSIPISATVRNPQQNSVRVDARKALAKRVCELNELAKKLLHSTTPLSECALARINCAIERKPDLAVLYRDRASVYFYQLATNKQYLEQQELLQIVVQDYSDASGHKDTLKKLKDKVKTSASLIASDYVDGRLRWPSLLKPKPEDTLAEMTTFLGRKETAGPSDDDDKNTIKDAVAHLHDLQDAPNAIDGVKKLKASALKACELSNFRSDGSADDIDALVILAGAYAISGDFRYAEYYQNRAAYFSYAVPLYEGKRPGFLDTREEYRGEIPPDDTNPSCARLVRHATRRTAGDFVGKMTSLAA